MNVAQETLGFRRAGLSPALSLLMSAFALPIPPATLSSHLHRPTERSPTIQTLLLTRSRMSFVNSTRLLTRLDVVVVALAQRQATAAIRGSHRHRLRSSFRVCRRRCASKW